MHIPHSKFVTIDGDSDWAPSAPSAVIYGLLSSTYTEWMSCISITMKVYLVVWQCLELEDNYLLKV